MPRSLYQYRCPDGHLCDAHHEDGEEPEVVACPKNGCVHAATGIGPRPPNRFTFHDYRCPTGTITRDVANDWAAGERPTTPRPCDCGKCGSFATLVTSGGANIAQWSVRTFGAQDGYYDRGLGRRVKSAAHRQEIMRELGVREGGGLDETERAISREKSRGEAIEKAFDADIRELNRDPDLLRLRDQGRFDFPTVDP